MGLFKKFVGNALSKAMGMPDQKFIEIVRANDRGEEWANEEIAKLWNSGEKDIAAKVNRARVFIYEEQAKAGDRDAILYYARGLAYSDRKEEALQWYFKLIEKNDARAMRELSELYTQYGALGDNRAEHKKWLVNAARCGDSEAQARLALLLSAEGNEKESRIWYGESAKQKCPKGELGFAQCVRDDMLFLNIYCKGAQKNEKINEVLERYNISSADEAIKLLPTLVEYCEELLCDVMDNSDSGDDAADAARALSGLYLTPPDTAVKPLYYRGVYMKFLSCLISSDGEDTMPRAVVDDIAKYHLDVSAADLRFWSDLSNSFSDWAERKGIDE